MKKSSENFMKAVINKGVQMGNNVVEKATKSVIQKNDRLSDLENE